MTANSLSVRPTLFHCLVRDRTIFLDLEADRYFALPADLEATFRHVAAGALCDPDNPAATKRLIDMGILADDHDSIDAPPRDVPVAAVSSLLDDDLGKQRFLRSIWAAFRQLRVRTELKVSPLAAVVDRRRRAAARVRESELNVCRQFEIARDAVTDAIGMDQILSPHLRCLPRAIAIFDMMAAAGVAPSIVFGVNDTRFGAHCWVQLHETVLSDTVEGVSAYKPILVI